MTALSRHLLLLLGVAGCSSISGSDPSLWTPTKDFGGSRVQGPPAGTPTAGAGGESAGMGGSPVTTPEAGGSSPMGSGGAAGGMSTGTGGGIGGIGQGGTAGTGSGGIAPGTAGGSSGDSAGMQQGAGGSLGGNSGKCTFTFSATTVTANGRYAPTNAGAIWITDDKKAFVKTLRVWTPRYTSQVTAWVQSSGRNTVDAVTGGSRKSHGPIDATWDCTNVSRAAVADGQYTAHISFAEQDAPFFGGGTPIQASVNFVKSRAGDDVSGQDTTNIKSIHAKLTIQ
jgi:hypothetical protein